MSRGQILLRVTSDTEPTREWYADDVTRVVGYNPATLDAVDLEPVGEHLYAWPPGFTEAICYFDDTDLIARFPIANHVTHDDEWTTITLDLRSQGGGIPGHVDRIKG